MSDKHEHKKNKPDWLEEFENLANEELVEGSACTQVHPIMANWYEEIMSGDPPESRDAVWQAMQCLTTEVLNDIPDVLTNNLSEEEIDETLSDWVMELLLVGRALQKALDSGRLDDL